jgi:hypothetical protein
MTYSQLIKHTGASSTLKAMEQRARRMAARRAMHITKLNSRSRWVNTFGPYMIVDGRNTVTDYAIPTIEQVIDKLAEMEVE